MNDENKDFQPPKTSAFIAAIESETGKALTNKIFGKLELLSKSLKLKQQAKSLEEQIFEVNYSFKNELLEKVFDRYLSFRTLVSRDVDQFVGHIYQPTRLATLGKSNNIFFIREKTDYFNSKISCIIGKAGQGKTTLLKKLLLNTLTSQRRKFPIIINLREVIWNDETTVTSVVRHELQKIGLLANFDTVDHLLESKLFEIYYDGFDEVELEDRLSAISLVLDTNTLYNLPCIVTTRPNTEIEKIGGAVTNYQLLDLTSTQVKSMIENNHIVAEKDKKLILASLENRKDISETLVSPILVDIYISTFNSLTEEPKCIVDFYSELFLILASTHDRFKIGFNRKAISNLNNHELKKVFQTACFILLNTQNTTTFSQSQILEAFIKASKSNGFNEDYYIHEDIINKTSLIKHDGLYYTFIHKSILEFHSALHILTLNDKARTRFYHTAINTPKAANENVLRFAQQLGDDLFYLEFLGHLLDKIDKIIGFKSLTKPLFSYELYKGIKRSAHFEITYTKLGSTPRIQEYIDQNQSFELAKLIDLVCMFYAVRLPHTNDQLLFELVKNKCNSLLQQSEVCPIKTKSKPDGEHITSFIFSLEELISQEELHNVLVDQYMLVKFFEDINYLYSLVCSRKKAYDERNSFSEFY